MHLPDNLDVGYLNWHVTLIAAVHSDGVGARREKIKIPALNNPVPVKPAIPADVSFTSFSVH